MDERVEPSSEEITTDVNTVPMELMRSIVWLIAAAEENGSPALTAEQLANNLRQSEGTIKRACAHLEAQGSIKASSKASEHTNPSYVTSQQEASMPQDDEAAARDKIVKTVLRATVAVFRSNLKVGIRLAGTELKDDQVTTDDLSIFIRVTGRLEGSICFGLSRKVARELIELMTRHRVKSIDQKGIRTLNSLVDRIIHVAHGELQSDGISIDVWPASTVQPEGMRITTLGVSQVVATLNSQLGPIVVHVVLRETPIEEELAA
jgi:CheY-specific phosphatase CheX